MLLEYEALFLVRPRESFGTRVGAQANAPGPVIQDPDDGEGAVILTLDPGNDHVARSFDLGQYDSEADFRSAIADAFGPELEWVAALSEAVYDGESPDGCQLDATDDDCGGDGGGGGGGGGGGFTPLVSSDPTYLDQLHLYRDLDALGDSEIRLDYEVVMGPNVLRVTWEHYDVKAGVTLEIDHLLLSVSPIQGGHTFFLTATELDVFEDDV